MCNKSKYFLLILLAAFFSLSGCVFNSEPEEIRTTPDSSEIWRSEAFAQRFQEAAPQGPTVVESAIELSEKYAVLTEEASSLRQQNQNLNSRNQQLREQVVALEDKLKQTQKELREANEVLIEMRIELNNWKADVLGFRDEMRSAETAQLQALLKILKVLGGDSFIEAAQGNAIGQAVATAN